MIALLILHRNSVVSIDRAVDAIWGEKPPARAVDTLRVYVSQIRKMIGEELDSVVDVETAPGGYRLVVDPGLVDVERFERLLHDGRLEAKARRWPESREALSAALQLRRGPAYPELEDDHHARAEAARLAELQLIATEELGDVRLSLGEHRDLVAELEGLVAHHPLRERLWGQLMLAQYRSGQQSAALRTFRRVREALVNELGVEPAKELAELEYQILVQDERLDSWRSRPSSIPVYTSTFIGRRRDTERLRHHLTTSRLVTIVGTAGVGKTRLAAELGRLVSEEVDIPVWWVDLSAAVTRADVYRATFRALSIREVPGLDDEALVVARLRHQDGVLIVDDCGPVAEVVSLISIVLGCGDGVGVIATSQQPLRLGGETVYSLPPLEVPPPEVERVDRVLEYDAVRLLVARSSAQSGRLTWSEQDLGLASELVRRLDGIPLAIELTAAVLPTLTIRDLVEELDRTVDLLVGGDPVRLPRHRTLATAVGWSLSRLAPDLIEPLRRMTVFATDFDLAAAEAVMGPTASSPAAVLAALGDRSLLRADTTTPRTRFRVFGTVSMVANTGESEAVLDDARWRHREHFRQRGEQVWREMFGPEIGAWLDRTALDHADCLVAVRGYLDRDEGDPALQLASALSVFWFRTGYLRESQALLTDTLEAAGPASRWRPRGLAGLAQLASAAGRADSDSIAEEAERASRYDADPLVRASTLDTLIHSLIGRGQIEAAAAAADQLAGFASEVPSDEGVAVAHLDLGMVLHSQGDLDGAWEHLVAARDRFRRWRKDVDAGWTLVALADVALLRGACDEALSSAEAATRDFRARGDLRGVAASLTCSGRVWHDQGEDARAVAVLSEAVEIADGWSYAAEGDNARQALALAQSGVH